MVDSESIALRAWTRSLASKSGVAKTQRRPRRPPCHPTSTPCSPHFMSSPTISCPSGAAPDADRGSAMPRSSVWRSPRSSSTAPRSEPSCVWPDAAWGSSSPTSPASRLQQARPAARALDRRALHRPRPALALLLRPVAAARLEPDPVRPIARNGQALAARRVRGLRLLRLAFALLLGLPPVLALRSGRDADRVRARSRERPRARSCG
jgi:hypothetical protein